MEDEANQFIKALGKVIQEHRKKHGYSQESFAQYVDVHRTYMGAIERGEVNITIKKLLALCEALEVKVSDLIRDTERSVEKQN